MFNKYVTKTNREERYLEKEFTKVCNNFNKIFTVKKENKIDKGLEISTDLDNLFSHIVDYRKTIKSDLDTLAFELLSNLYSCVEKEKAFTQYTELLKGNFEQPDKQPNILSYYPIVKKEKLFKHLIKFDHYCYLMLQELLQLKLEVAKELAKDYNVQDILLKVGCE